MIQQAYTGQGNPTAMVLERVGSLTPAADVALFRLEAPLVQGMIVDASSEGIIFSQDVFILGFPYDLALQLDMTSTQELPLVKKGILAGQKHGSDGSLFFVDVIANPDFSGGPMVFRHEETRQLRFGGVVKGQFTQPATSDVASGTGARSPAGITAVTDISEVLVLLA